MQVGSKNTCEQIFAKNNFLHFLQIDCFWLQSHLLSQLCSTADSQTFRQVNLWWRHQMDHWPSTDDAFVLPNRSIDPWRWRRTGFKPGTGSWPPEPRRRGSTISSNPSTRGSGPTRPEWAAPVATSPTRWRSTTGRRWVTSSCPRLWGRWDPWDRWQRWPITV